MNVERLKLASASITDDGEEPDRLQCQRLFSLTAQEGLALSASDGPSARERLKDPSRVTKRDEAWRAYEIAAREIQQRKDALMDEVEKKLSQQVTETPLFLVRRRLD